MLARLLLVLSALLSLGVDAQAQNAGQPAYLSLGTPTNWKIADLPIAYSYYDRQDRSWEVTLDVSKTPEGNPKLLTLSVSSEKTQPLTTTMDIEYGATDGTLGAYEFDTGTPTFIMTNFSMGAHCCYMARAISFDDSKLVAVDVGEYDGGFVVRDIDGDGTQEIDTVDQRFLYAFDSYAMSLAPRKIVKVRGGTLEDVTRDPPYQAYLLGQINRFESECYGGTSAGICAGVLGNAANVGLYRSVASQVPFKAITAAMEKTYLECSAEECGKATLFKSSSEAMEFRLKAWGYNTASSMNERSRAFFRKLAAYSNGFGATVDTGESTCGTGPVRFSMNKAANYVHMQGYEYSCRLERINVLDTSAIGVGLCAAEGESYHGLILVELKQDTLYLSSIYGGMVYPVDKPASFNACP